MKLTRTWEVREGVMELRTEATIEGQTATAATVMDRHLTPMFSPVREIEYVHRRRIMRMIEERLFGDTL